MSVEVTKGNVNIILKRANEVIADGGLPSKDVHDGIVGYLHSRGPDPDWDAVPLARTWFTQIA